MKTRSASQESSARGARTGHDKVVIGSSMGGIEALSTLVAGFPADLDAAVFVVQHTAPGLSLLPEILSRAGPLRATHALHGEAIEKGRIYVAPPDNHMLVRAGAVSVVRGPRENGHRPSVDALFRSAAQSYGPRVIGAVLTGSLDCGTAGALSIKARNGLVMVQDPDEARAPSMPRSVLKHLKPDHVVSIGEMAALIARLVAEPVAEAPAALPRSVIEMEGGELGLPMSVVCPHCEGAISESNNEGFRYFRCHVGHAFSGAYMTREQEAQVERSLWSAMRAMEENAMLLERLEEIASGELKKRYSERARERRQQVELLRGILLQPQQRAPIVPEHVDDA